MKGGWQEEMNEEDMIHFDMDGIPKRWVNAIKRVYGSYPKECMPMGICDMAYIVNIISHELGLSDGRMNFKESQEEN